MHIETITSLSQIDAAAWNALNRDNNPFLRHQFLYALERHDCVGEQWGWLPCHLLLREQEQLLAAAPMYIKTNSYGEFVFDWSWAHAYQRAGLDYYPKLVLSVPYTPIQGARLMLAEESQRPYISARVSDWIKQLCRQNRFSGAHVLFPQEQEISPLEQQGFLRRMDCQFHWFNHDYRSFDDFLATLTAEKRKKIKRERRRVQEAGIHIRVVHGQEAGQREWAAFHQFYCDTFDRRGGYPTLSREFFEDISTTMGQNIVLVLAEHQQRIVAGALCFRNAHTLYGRHWGCAANFHSLHFELCYYQGIAYCIEHRLRAFEPGAQGEHKISRGFIPVTTLSAHWLADPAFHALIADFLERERKSVAHYIDELNQHKPYKNPPLSAGA